MLRCNILLAGSDTEQGRRPSGRGLQARVTDAAAQAFPAGAEVASTAPVLKEVGRLQGITLSFWQDQLERTMTTGQAIMVCRSPEEAIRLQLAYVRASLVSGIQRAGEVTRWAPEIARDALPSRRR
jgi:hypothetical protein